MGCSIKRAFVGLWIVGAAWAGAETILLNPPSPYVADAQTIEKVEDIVAEAIVLADRLYGQHFTVQYGTAMKPDYTVDLIPVNTPQYSALTLMMTRTSDQSAANPEAIQGTLDHTTARILAAALYFQWSSFRGYFQESYGPPPQLLDDLPTDAVAPSVLPLGYPATLMPSSVAVRPNGNFVVAMMSLAVEFDPSFRIVGQPGRSLFDAGNVTGAYGVSVTPAGTVFLKPSMGREINKIIEGAPRPQRIRVSMDVSGAFIALPDSSFVLADWSKKTAIRYEGRKQQQLDLFSSEYSFITAMGVGPEGNLWVCDSNVHSVRIYSPDGELLDVIVPVVDAMVGGTASSLAVYSDGSFVIASSMGNLMRYRRDGTPVWKLTELYPGEFIPQMMQVGVDSTRGLVYIADLMGKRVLRLMDTGYREEHGIRGGIEDTIATLTLRQIADPGDLDPIIEKANLYQEEGAFEMTKHLWQSVLDIDPFNALAADKLDSIQALLLTERARTLKAKALELLDTVGPASAQPSHDSAMRLFEQVLSMTPEADDVRAEAEDLSRRFREFGSEQERRLPLTIASLELGNIFPSLLQFYRNNPVGGVVVQNGLSEEVTDVRASIFIKRYMDYPSESQRVDTLASGQEARLELPLLLNTQVFELQEDLPVQVEVRVSYKAGGADQEVSKNGFLTIYRRSAMSWDDSGKISSFIMPNESTVSSFSHRVSEVSQETEKYRISRRFFRAMRICDALGVYGITYVEDPDSPISAILGKAEAIDTVRFPRTTLLIKSGDCDDTTALLGSLLESSGISTAVMTSPGHVFLAFDSGEPEENAWLFEAEGFEIIEYDGSVWIPVETTIIREGFFTAWHEASKLVAKYDGDELEFLPVAEQRSVYPALPLPESSFTVVEPSSDRVDEMNVGSVSDVEDRLYTGVLAGLEEQLQGRSGTRALKVKNRVGIVHARFGNDGEAIRTFEACIVEDEDFLSSYVNLANVYLTSDEVPKAIDVLGDAFDRKPDSALINLLLAQSYAKVGDQGKVEEYFARVEQASPRLALRYASLVTTGDGTARASDAQADAIVIWDSGDE